jgi:hypothetical protein
MPPKFSRKRAEFVLAKIDEILAWEKSREMERDTKFVELGRYLCEVRAGQYWRLETLRSFDEFLERRFPESRRKAYYLMSIHENLPPQARKELKKVGWAKGIELAKLARRDRQDFDCATWLHKARELSKEDFQQAVERELTGKITEPWEIVYFKLYESQIPVIDRALETAALMLGSDRSRGYCLEMICADFLAGANLDNGDSGDAAVLDDEILQASTRRSAGGFPGELGRERTMSSTNSNSTRLRLDPESYEILRQRVLHRDGWRCQSCGTMSNLEVHHQQFRSHSGHDSEENLITLCSACHGKVHQ